jgi:hypothetical protein
MNTNKFIQQKISDILEQTYMPSVVSGKTHYEIAGLILDAIRFVGLPQAPTTPETHDCRLDEWGSGHCSDPSHEFDLVDDERAIHEPLSR